MPIILSGLEQVGVIETPSSAWKADIIAVIPHLHMYWGKGVNRTTLHNAAPHCYFGNRLTISPRGILMRVLVLDLRVSLEISEGKRN